MRHPIKENTQFKFGDNVIVKYGFYRGMAAEVQDYVTKIEPVDFGFFRAAKTKHEKYYQVKTTRGNLELFVFEDQIEHVGKK